MCIRDRGSSKLDRRFGTVIWLYMLTTFLAAAIASITSFKMCIRDSIKLMKCGGITNALRIASAAEVYGVECMIGCMLEAKISVLSLIHI